MISAELVQKPKLGVEDLPMIHLSHGGHKNRAEGVCAMEAAAWLAGREHTDSPVCVSPVIASFIRYWNDTLSTDEDRDRLLKPLLPEILETKTSPEAETERAWLAIDWLARTYTPTFFDLTPSLKPHAKALRKLAPFTRETAKTNQVILDKAREAGAAARAAAGAAARAAARAAAWDAAGAAARAAAWDAAGDAAWDAAGAAAGDAAWAAAWAAAWDAAWAAAWAAARAAAWAAAGDAAWDAARAAARAAAWDAAGAAAWAKLQPVVVTLQQSAQDLVRRMVKL